MASPIWRDYYITLGSTDSVEFRVQCNNEVIYVGKAYKRPSDSVITIKINDICADYIPLVAPSAMNGFTKTGAASFVVQKKSSFTWKDVVSVTFYNDWSHDTKFNPESRGLSCPVNNRLGLLTPLVFSVVNAIEVEIEIESGEDIRYSYFSPGTENDPGCYMISLVDSECKVGDLLSVTEETISDRIDYQVVDFCGRYALYYQNAFGGWDSLLIEGSHSEADNLTRHTREVEYDNRNISNRGKENYVNEISKNLTLHTSWLSDDESSRMHHLLNSPSVYLYDTITSEMIPVVLTNTTTEYKTYKGNGGRLVNYAIEVSFANDRIRR